MNCAYHCRSDKSRELYRAIMKTKLSIPQHKEEIYTRRVLENKAVQLTGKASVATYWKEWR